MRRPSGQDRVRTKRLRERLAEGQGVKSTAPVPDAAARLSYPFASGGFRRPPYRDRIQSLMSLPLRPAPHFRP